METIPTRYLGRALKGHSIVELCRRRLAPDKLRGFVVGFSPTLLLLHVLNDEIKLNGYTVIRRRDISLFQVAEHEDFYLRVLKLRRLVPRALRGVALESVSSLVSSASRRFPLITIYQERKDPDSCFIGSPQQTTDTMLDLKCIIPGAQWDPDPFRIRLNSVTRINFGGAYEEALAIASKASSKPKRTRG